MGQPGGDNIRRKMAYSPLGELEIDQDQVNIYGVVVDASLPYKTNNNKYVCTIKVID